MRVRSFDSFEVLRAACPEMAGAPHSSLFESVEWFEHLLRHGMSGKAALSLLLLGDSPASLLCLPLIRSVQGMESLSNYYSGIYGPIGNESRLPATWLAACKHMRNSEPRPGTIIIKPLDPESAFFLQMREALRSSGYWADDYFCFGNWYLPTADVRFSDYLSSRPSALRNTLRRGRNKLDKAGQWQIVIHSRPGPELDDAIVAYEDIYASSWKAPEAHPRFIPELCQLAARQGWLRLGVLSLDGKAIASQLWLFSDRRSFIFKLAYDPAAARCSPGTVLTAAMMEHAMEHDHAIEIDYLSGDDTYKQDWMSKRRERRGLIAFDPATPKGLLAGMRHFAARAARSLLGKWQT